MSLPEDDSNFRLGDGSDGFYQSAIVLVNFDPHAD